MMTLALEIEDGVDQVLEHARAGQGALLRDVTDEKRGDAAPLRQGHQARAALAHLRDAARRGFQVG